MHRRSALLHGLAAMALLTAPAALAQNPADAVADVPLAERGYALGDMVIGAEDAPVEIIEYSSLLCPHCADFHTGTFPEIKERYIDTGKVRFVYRDFFGNQVGLWATMLTRCGGEASFHESIAVFYAQQETFLQGISGSDPVAALNRMGQLIGLSPERMNQCLSDEPFMLALVEDLQKNMGEYDVTSTPTFIINGEMHSGNRPPEAFAALIDAHL